MSALEASAQGPAGDAGHPGALLEGTGERQHLEGLFLAD